MEKRRLTLLLALTLAACSTTEPRPPAPGEPALELGPPGSTAATEPPAVVVRVKQHDGRFVAEVVDVRGKNGSLPPDPTARKQAIDRLQSLLGEKVKVVDPQTLVPLAPQPTP